MKIPSAGVSVGVALVPEFVAVAAVALHGHPWVGVLGHALDQHPFVWDPGGGKDVVEIVTEDRRRTLMR